MQGPRKSSDQIHSITTTPCTSLIDTVKEAASRPTLKVHRLFATLQNGRLNLRLCHFTLGTKEQRGTFAHVLLQRFGKTGSAELKCHTSGTLSCLMIAETLICFHAQDIFHQLLAVKNEISRGRLGYRRWVVVRPLRSRRHKPPTKSQSYNSQRRDLIWRYKPFALHTDFGPITLPFQESVGGPEIEDWTNLEPNSFLPLPPTDTVEIIINVDDTLTH